MTKQTLAIEGGTPVRSEPMPFRQAFGPEEKALLVEAADYYMSLGEDPPYQGHYEEMFCKAFSEFMGGGYADAVSTGGAAVHVALATLELPKGSEVIISPMVPCGPVNSIILQGYTPVVADSMKNSYNIGVGQFLDRVTDKTSCLLAVHSAGEPLEIDLIVEEAHKRNIKVLEDCSQAPGAIWKSKKVGTFGDIAALSTMYRKTLATSSCGGIVYSQDLETYRKARAYADRGMPRWRTDIDLRDPSNAMFPALNFNSNEFACAVGLSSLNRLQDSVDKRVNFVNRLIELLEAHAEVCKPSPFHNGHSPFFYPIFVDSSKISVSKTNFAKAIQAEGIGLGEHYGCIISTWEWVKDYLSDDIASKNAINIQENSFNLYVNERYGEKEAQDIIEAILKVESHYLIP